MADAILLRGVTKTFGPKVAVRDLDLAIPAGSLTGFIGPNGAGKTTTLRMVMSIFFPDKGEVSVLGRGSALEAKDRIGYLPEERGLYKKMKVGSFLQYMAALKGEEGQGLERRAREWLARVGLAEVEKKRCEELSKGMQQKVQFLAAVLHEPELLILDEPFSGLDPVSTRQLRELIREQHRRGATILFSTHVMAQAEQICQRVVMIHDGAKVLDASIEEIHRRHDPRTVRLEPRAPGADPAPLRALPGVLEIVPDGTAWDLLLDGTVDGCQVMQDAMAALPAARVELRRPTLEDVFIEIVTRGAPGAQASQLRAALTGVEAGG